MDRAEALVLEHLQRRFPGAGRIVHEPDGSVPPDFLVDGRLAIEVRRLNEHGRGPDARPLIESEIPFINGVRKVASSLPPRPDGTPLVFVEFRRPLPESRRVRTAAREYLRSILAADNPVGLEREIAPGVKMCCLANGSKSSRSVVLGWLDLDGGGFELPRLKRNLELCVAEKSAKTAPFRHKYPEWWLVLPDYVSFGSDEYGVAGTGEYLQLTHDWHRILLLDPLNVAQSLELS